MGGASIEDRGLGGQAAALPLPLRRAGGFSKHFGIGHYILPASQETLRGFQEEKEGDSTV